MAQEQTLKKRHTSCTGCNRSFWYLDPRAGGRPRKKCGLCSSRPPRYPWSYTASGEPIHQEVQAYIPPQPVTQPTQPVAQEAASPKNAWFKRNRSLVNGMTSTRTIAQVVNAPEHTSSVRVVTQSSSSSHSSSQRSEGATTHHLALIEGSKAEATSTKRKRGRGEDDRFHHSKTSDDALHVLQQQLSKLEERLDRLESKLVGRNEWVDLSARLDIVERDTNQTLRTVHDRMSSFGKEVKQIAIVPEKELHEMYNMVKMVRSYLRSEVNGNQHKRRS